MVLNIVVCSKKSKSQLFFSFNRMSIRHVETGKKYVYKTVWDDSILAPISRSVPFVLLVEVQAPSDAHVLLGGYEIVIGGWKNTRSEIRRGKQKEAIATIFHPKNNGPLNPNSSSKFWISVVNGSSIAVGYGWEVWLQTFLVAVDKKQNLVDSVAISTGFGSEGIWNIHVMSKKESREESESSPIKSVAATPVIRSVGPPATAEAATVAAASSIRRTLVSSSSSLLKRSREPSIVEDTDINDENDRSIQRTIAKHTNRTFA